MKHTSEIIREKKIVVIVRGTYGSDLLHLAEALNRGGIRLLEVTYEQNRPDGLSLTAEAIASIKAEFGSSLLVGAGTVLSVEQIEAAQQAGGAYIISPNTDAAIIQATKQRGLVSIPGAMTPSEILNAHHAGADFVKLFPAGTLGMRYIKDIRAPISHVPLIATGGVTEENFPEFLDLGLVGAGISGRLTDKQLIASADWDEFTRRAEIFVSLATR
ncbi:MAG TPA: bifunctional 4-hydroxy-2-oxoglutarate aldolase/2-dehydro-3-deoxy-phosphogluconate aldolase [Sphaerochaeta sp.]|nr:bifunctional 4-hydroxy-2-oxoglutarate aldolase/2-dehydro-3-deoxy-phosphogluconate aldolase [Sphaerochaeta sp.]